ARDPESHPAIADAGRAKVSRSAVRVRPTVSGDALVSTRSAQARACRMAFGVGEAGVIGARANAGAADAKLKTAAVGSAIAAAVVRAARLEAALEGTRAGGPIRGARCSLGPVLHRPPALDPAFAGAAIAPRRRRPGRAGAAIAPRRRRPGRAGAAIA